MDMTNAFFQTRVHPDDVHLTAISTPLGLYEWLAMPMGLKNAPAIHQRRMTAALRKYIGKICHVYLDDIIIWSQTVEEHEKHLRLVLAALRDAKLFCNPAKCEFFKLEIDFLGHHLSQRGVEANTSKVDKVLNWPRPKSTRDVRGFLGLVRYIASFLPRLAEYTRVLTPLTTKAAKASFPPWTDEHEDAFVNIKKLVTSRECLTVIEHDNPGENRIFVTCDASDWRTGAVLSFGPTWESARPVAFDSMQLKGAEKNYPVHEKEMLAIVRALKKWRTDLMGSTFEIWTDHRTLENFNTQRDLSRRQLRWQEFLSQYECSIVYIKGEDNTVADGLSRIPENAFPDEMLENAEPHQVWSAGATIGAVLRVTTDVSVLEDIKRGYESDEFCKRLSTLGMTHAKLVNGLWYVGDRLVIPRAGSIRENLFRMAHDELGHFGSDKCYANLRDAYYWPNMRRDLEQSYIPGCAECQRNKSRTKKVAGPLHPLPVPDTRGSSVAIDFVGPLPKDGGFDCLLTMTDRLGSDYRLVPTVTTLTAEGLAGIFFDNWYCENGLPDEIVCDRDKLFVSKFWRALTSLVGIKLKMSSSFHPETDGASEKTNKTVNQALRFHVRRNQTGWVKALPKIRFDLMNSVNKSTGFSGFQVRMGRAPRLMPPMVTREDLPEHLASTSEGLAAVRVIDDIREIEQEARDNLLAAKVQQAHFANANRGPEHAYKVGDLAMLSTLHRRNQYKHANEKRVAKFMPRWDGPYEVIGVHAETSNYTLDVPNAPGIFPTFHASELKPHVKNDGELYPHREDAQPGPVLTGDGMEEYAVESIIDSRKRGRGWQYLVRWVGYGPEHDRWLPRRELEECEALDLWLSDHDV